MAQLTQVSPSAQSTRNFDLLNANLHEGWTAAVLLTLMLFIVTASVAAANWADGVVLTPYAVIAGMFFGMLVSRLRLSGWLAHPLALLEGAFATIFLASFLVQPPFATWNEKLVVIEGRLGKWLTQVLAGGIGQDALIFVISLCALAWVIGYIAAWSVFREHEPWGAILPAGAGLLVNLFYAPPQSGIFLMIFLLCAMLLLVRTTLLRRQEMWQRFSIRYASDIGLDFLTYGIVFSGLIILASWLVPPTAPGPQWFSGITERVRAPWQDVSDNMTRMFSTVRNANSGGPTTFFGNSLAMGGPIHLGSRPVFDIQASNGRYWRATVFDKYTGSGWVSTATESSSYLAYDPRLAPPPANQRRVVTQTVQVLLPGDNLVVAASQPLRVSEPTDVRYSSFALSVDNVYQDIAAIRMQKPLRGGEIYTVVSSLSGADEDSLRAAPDTFPSYIAERYLQLPATIPPRVHDLALQITAGATTNYDKARAIEKYLRAHIEYDDSVQPAPVGRDGVDYTLFDRPAGYCNYYASAMAVLAREVGIPARVGSGYAVSESDAGTYHVGEGNAHSWPELYFSNLGWVEFEPTASKPEIVRPAKKPKSTLNDDDEQSNFNSNADDTDRPPRRTFSRDDAQDVAAPQSFSIPLPSGPAGVALGVGSGALLLGLVTLGVLQFAWSRRMRKLSPGARAWEEMYRFARWVGLRERAEATPRERAADLKRALPQADAPIGDLTDLYVRERYGAQQLSPAERARASVAGTQLRRHVLRGAVEHLIGARVTGALNAARRAINSQKSSSGEKR